jgi:hypothetical protein
LANRTRHIQVGVVVGVIFGILLYVFVWVPQKGFDILLLPVFIIIGFCIPIFGSELADLDQLDKAGIPGKFFSHRDWKTHTWPGFALGFGGFLLILATYFDFKLIYFTIFGFLAVCHASHVFLDILPGEKEEESLAAYGKRVGSLITSEKGRQKMFGGTYNLNIPGSVTTTKGKKERKRLSYRRTIICLICSGVTELFFVALAALMLLSLISSWLAILLFVSWTVIFAAGFIALWTIKAKQAPVYHPKPKSKTT